MTRSTTCVWRRIFAAAGVPATIVCALAGMLAAGTASAQTPEQQAKAPAAGSAASGAAAVTAAPAKNDYSSGENWLCLPGRQDACATDLSTTVIAADGKFSIEKFAANPNAPIDCFYVYPTVSAELTFNSDMALGPEEKGVARTQFARFGSVCRLYAPLYRQVTLAALRAAYTGMPPTPEEVERGRALAYHDVADAWNYYLEHHNHGRGVVLIGHSQGSSILTYLIREEIDGKPVEARLVSAILTGTNLAVPKGKDVGGAFEQIPLCQAATQTGCAITYASFRANAPPPANTRYGRAKGEGMMAGCTNPASLGGGSGELHAYLPSGNEEHIVRGVTAEQGPWVVPPRPVHTPFVSVPGMLTAECVSNEHGSYLAVTVHSDPAGPRAHDITGDLVINGYVLPDWGLHMIDVNLALGNLVEIVGEESKAYLAAAKKR